MCIVQAHVCRQGSVFTVCECLQACVHETITLTCSQAVRSSEMRQGQITLQALINSTDKEEWREQL